MSLIKHIANRLLPHLRQTILAVLWIVSSALFAEDNLTNLHISPERSRIVITYDLHQNSYVDLKVTYTNHGKKEELTLFDHKRNNNNAHISGDVGNVRKGKNKKIVWEVLAERDSFIYEDVRFGVDVSPLYTGKKTFLIGQFGYSLAPQTSGGFMLGGVMPIGGVYISLRSNFNTVKSSANATENAQIDNISPFYTGKTDNMHTIANVGLVVDMLGNHWDKSILALYAGAGYGVRNHYYETTDGEWVLYKPNSYQTYSVEGGLIASFSGFTITGGVSTIGFKYLDFVVGVGITIPKKAN